jgi:thiol-disulfide isomerase/thioredoxin|tara:strand:+ start:212 stop:637 length:426 start_codon:yes stop_codon:yes gene_type:complete
VKYKTIMKKLAIIFILAFGLMASSTIADSSSSSLVDAEPKYLTSDTFNKAINTGIVIVEFVASFAEPFSEWEAIEDGEYYRVDIEKYPDLKKKYKVRSIPTIMVFSNGAKELTYRANIMLELDVTAEEIHEDIEDLFSDKF